MMTLSPSQSLASMVMRPSFPSIPRGQLYTSRLERRRNGKLEICRSLCLQAKNGIRQTLDLATDGLENKLRCERSGLLESGIPKREVAALRQREMDSCVETWGQVENANLRRYPQTLNEKTFCQRLISSVNIATTYRDDVDEAIERRKESGVHMTDRHSKVGPEELSRKWNIGLQTAKDTLDVTTQHGVRTAVHPMSRRLRVDHLHLHRPRLRGMWFVDTLIAKVKSLLGNKVANVYTNGKFTKVVPMTARDDAGESLTEFTDDVGIPEMLTTDGAGEFTGKIQGVYEACTSNAN